jgi:class 3 adenylate cyclase
VAGIDFEAEGLLENLGDAAMFASLDFSFAGKHRFKGLSGDVAVHRLRRASGTD